MPVIRRAHNYGVDIPVLEKFTVVSMTGDSVVALAGLLAVVVVHQPFSIFHAFAVEIADSHDSSAVVPQHGRHVMSPRDSSGSDGGDVDSFTWSLLPEHRGWND